MDKDSFEELESLRDLARPFLCRRDFTGTGWSPEGSWWNAAYSNTTVMLLYQADEQSAIYRENKLTGTHLGSSHLEAVRAV